MKKIYLILTGLTTLVLVRCSSTVYYRNAYAAVQDNYKHQPIIITYAFDGECRRVMTNSKGKKFWADLCEGEVGDTVKIMPGIMPGEILKVQ